MYAQVWRWEGDTLYHHGVLGQHWGVMNGPPYPLAPGDHSASEKRAGWRKSLEYDNYKSAKKRYKAAKLERKAQKSKLNESRYDQSVARTKESYKRAKLSVKAQKAMTKASKLTLAEAKKDLKTAKAELKVRKAIERTEAKDNKRIEKAQLKNLEDRQKAKKDAEKDLEYMRAVLPGSRATPSSRDYSGYAKRHSDRDSSLYSKRLSKKGGAKVSEAYAEEYEFARQKLLSDYKKWGMNDKHLSRLDSLTKPKFNVPSGVTKMAEGYSANREQFITRAKNLQKKDNFVSAAKALRSQGLSYNEIADRLQIPDGTVYALINEKLD